MKASRPRSSRSQTDKQAGVTLFELLVAVLLLAMVSTMIYSVLKAGIDFNGKGEDKLQRLAQEQGLVGLLRRQVRGAIYDQQQRRPMISAGPDTLRLVTNQSLLAGESNTVLAVYRYNEADSALYYLEKKDFYNSDYDEDFQPNVEEMTRLLTTSFPLALGYEQESGQVTLEYNERQYLFAPKARPVAANIILSRLVQP
ncbi:MAG: prepilin-type N-terminal cleavage/methylation domain-containing protein [Desulfobulbaceae bacterium]|nr:prepilin-type N-terminal cleavage/methylation domain-containing protein [Desulfobulbaceae bacterium]HIJ78342.1 prepilin-type N-terminal cleavage/methylation domain-containing protein [Deltaproteobacteria bacterium]